MLEIFKEFFTFLKKRKKMWLIPLFLAFGIVGVFIFLTQGSAVAPFIYTLF